MLRVAKRVRSAMVDHALSGAPQEACGLFGGPPGEELVDHFFPTDNATASSTSFSIGGREMLDVESRADALGVEVKGVMHSHPNSDPYPSATDIADSTRFDPLGGWLSIIVSLVSDPPEMRAFRITNGVVEESAIEIR